MDEIYIVKVEGEDNIACETICKAMEFLRSAQRIDYDRELTEYVYQSNDVDYLRKMWSIDWRTDIYNRIEDKMKLEIEKYGFGKSYTGKIIIKEISIFEPSK